MKPIPSVWFAAWILLLGVLACEAPLELHPRCGDGKLISVAGELVETNFEACTAAGHFGGVSVTKDCLTLSERYCGNYRLLTMPASVKFPVLAHDADGQLWISGIVQGAFDGPTCPRRPLTWNTYCDDIEAGGGWRRHVDGYHHPGCDRAFIGRLGASRVPESLHHPGGRTPPQAILSLGTAGFALVRHHPDPEDLNFVVDWISPQGARLHSETVRHHFGRGEPQLVRNGDDEFALVTFASGYLEDILWISRFSIRTPGLIQTSVLPQQGSEPYPLYADGYHTEALILGEGPGVYRLVTYLQDWEGRRYLYMFNFEATAPEVVVTGLQVLDRQFSYLHLLDRVRDDGTFDLVWSTIGPDGASEFDVSTFADDGTVSATRRFQMPPYHYPQHIFRLPDGGWITGGLAHFSEEPPPTPVSCDFPRGQLGYYSLFATRFLPDGTETGTTYFASQTFDRLVDLLDPTAASVACDTGHVRYVLDGDALLVAGVYDRSEYFCAKAEPADRYRYEPVHTCGVFLVRLSP